MSQLPVWPISGKMPILELIVKGCTGGTSKLVLAHWMDFEFDDSAVRLDKKCFWCYAFFFNLVIFIYVIEKVQGSCIHAPLIFQKKNVPFFVIMIVKEMWCLHFLCFLKSCLAGVPTLVG